MNRFFEFSNSQMKTLAVLVVLAVVLAGYKFVRDYYLIPSTPATGWSVEYMDQYRPTLILNPNFAPADSLELIPGIGPEFARRIVDYRNNHGPFVAVDSLVNVSGIGPATLAKFKMYFEVQ